MCGWEGEKGLNTSYSKGRNNGKPFVRGTQWLFKAKAAFMPVYLQGNGKPLVSHGAYVAPWKGDGYPQFQLEHNLAVKTELTSCLCNNKEFITL